MEKEAFNNIVNNWNQTLIYCLGEPLLEMCTNFFGMKRKKLRNFFVSNKQRVCITTDARTSIKNYYYMVITSHFIDSE